MKKNKFKKDEYFGEIDENEQPAFENLDVGHALEDSFPGPLGNGRVSLSPQFIEDELDRERVFIIAETSKNTSSPRSNNPSTNYFDKSSSSSSKASQSPRKDMAVIIPPVSSAPVTAVASETSEQGTGSSFKKIFSKTDKTNDFVQAYLPAVASYPSPVSSSSTFSSSSSSSDSSSPIPALLEEADEYADEYADENREAVPNLILTSPPLVHQSSQENLLPSPSDYKDEGEPPPRPRPPSTYYGEESAGGEEIPLEKDRASPDFEVLKTSSTFPKRIEVSAEELTPIEEEDSGSAPSSARFLRLKDSFGNESGLKLMDSLQISYKALNSLSAFKQPKEEEWTAFQYASQDSLFHELNEFYSYSEMLDLLYATSSAFHGVIQKLEKEKGWYSRLEKEFPPPTHY